MENSEINRILAEKVMGRKNIDPFWWNNDGEIVAHNPSENQPCSACWNPCENMAQAMLVQAECLKRVCRQESEFDSATGKYYIRSESLSTSRNPQRRREQAHHAHHERLEMALCLWAVEVVR